MKKSFSFKTSNNNYYFYSENKKTTIIIHPIFYSIINKYLSIKNIIEVKSYYLDSLPSNGSNVKDIEYYLKKLEYLIFHGYFDELKDGIIPLEAAHIEKSLKEVKFIVFEVTEDCNLKCSYCSYGKYYDDYNIDRKKDKLPFHKAKLFLDRIYQMNNVDFLPYEVNIYFFGGEPLLRTDFMKEVIYYMKEKRPKQKVNYSMTTNAILLDKHMDFLVQYRFKLLISLDGDRESNYFRIYKNGKQAFDKIYKNLLLLKMQYPLYFIDYVQFNSVIHSKNKRRENINAFISENFDKKPVTNLIRNAGVRNDLKNDFEKKFLPEDLLKVKLERIDSFLLDNNNYVFENLLDIYNSQDDISNISSFFLNGTCVPFGVKIFVTAKGGIHVCEKVASKYKVGDINDDSNIKIDYNEIANDYNRYNNIIVKYCRLCYKNNCSKCMFETDLDSLIFKCDQFIGKEIFKNLITNQYSEAECNPEIIKAKQFNLKDVSLLSK